MNPSMFVYAILACCLIASSQQTDMSDVTVASIPVHLVVNGSTSIAQTSQHYVCLTVDWWPPEKCDYDRCSWGYSSVLNLDLNNTILRNAVKGLSPLTMRLGGTLQDQVVYLVKGTEDCPQFTRNLSHPFGFSGGCLNMSRWNEWNNFFEKTGAIVAFGLNALYPRKDLTIFEDWDPTNTQDFIRYTHKKGFKVRAWEFGNELSGDGINVSVPLNASVRDVKKLRPFIDEIYAGSKSKPMLVSPDGIYEYEPEWYKDFLVKTGKGVLDGLTHHIYNLGAGVAKNLTDQILDPKVLDNIRPAYLGLRDMIRKKGPWAEAWVGEAGGAYNSGGDNISNAFVSGFWYVDQLGMAASYNTSVYCRQTLIGGNYGVLDRETFVPNPDYYAALLWKRIMGHVVLHPHKTESPYLRAYTHCHKSAKGGLAAVFINLSNITEYHITTSVKDHKKQKRVAGGERHEYHLTPEDGDLHSKVVHLNGSPLRLTGSMLTGIPPIHPLTVDSSTSISVKPWSIVYAEIPDAGISACLP